MACAHSYNRWIHSCCFLPSNGHFRPCVLYRSVCCAHHLRSLIVRSYSLFWDSIRYFMSSGQSCSGAMSKRNLNIVRLSVCPSEKNIGKILTSKVRYYTRFNSKKYHILPHFWSKLCILPFWIHKRVSYYLMFHILLYCVICLTSWISYWIHDILPMKYLTWQMFNSYFCNILHIMYSISYFTDFLLWEILTSSVSYTCSFQTFCMDSYNFQPAQIWPCFRIPYFYDIIFLLYCWHDLTFR